jgi:hypothetical protein
MILWGVLIYLKAVFLAELKILSSDMNKKSKLENAMPPNNTYR